MCSLGEYLQIAYDFYLRFCYSRYNLERHCLWTDHARNSWCHCPCAHRRQCAGRDGPQSGSRSQDRGTVRQQPDLAGGKLAIETLVSDLGRLSSGALESLDKLKFLRRCPACPTLSKGNVVVLDNVGFHRSARRAVYQSQRRMAAAFPRLLPDLNPIEMAFSRSSRVGTCS